MSSFRPSDSNYGGYRGSDRDFRDRDSRRGNYPSSRDSYRRPSSFSRDRGHRGSSNQFPRGTGRVFHRKGPTGWDVTTPPYDNSDLSGSGGIGGSAGGGNGTSSSSQLIRHARRIYVGGLENVPEKEIADFFTDVIRKSIITPLPDNADPVLSVYINPERKFAFVELYSIELANAMMKADGLVFKKGVTLKIGRPSDYKPNLLRPELVDKVEPLDFSKLEIQSTNVAALNAGKEMLNRVFVGGLPSTMSENDLRELMSLAGVITHINIVRGPDGTPKGYGFVEYENMGCIDFAIKTFNGFSVMGRTLTVGRAKFGGATGGASDNFDNIQTGLFSTGVDNVVDNSSNNATSAYSDAPAVDTNGSSIILLENMLTKEDLDLPEDEFNLVIEDIVSECKKYGVVEPTAPRAPLPGAGRVFLLYADPAAAAAAIAALNGRVFGSSKVVARSFDTDDFMSGRWDK